MKTELKIVFDFEKRDFKVKFKILIWGKRSKKYKI
jgi:hypothetical protein